MANKTIGDLNSIALNKDSLLMGYESNSTGKLTVQDLFDIDLTEQTNSSVTDDMSRLKASVGTLETQVQNLMEKNKINNLVDGSTTGSVRGIGTAAQENSYIIGQYAMAEGYNTLAIGNNSHAEGDSTVSGGVGAHSEGKDSQANGSYSHAEGNNTNSTGNYSHAQNNNTIANSRSQTAIGEYNTTFSSSLSQDTRGQYAFMLGNGTADDSRSNALTIDWGGNVQMALDRSALTGTIDGDLLNALSNENILSSTIDHSTNMLDIKKTLTTIIKNQAWNNDWYFYSSLTKPSSYNDWVDNGFYINTDYIANDSNVFQSTYKNNNFIFISSTIRLNQDIPPSINSQPVVLFDFGTKLFLGQFKVALFAGFYNTQIPVHTFQASNSQICYYSSDNTTITASEPLFLQFILPYTMRLK